MNFTTTTTIFAAIVHTCQDPHKTHQVAVVLDDEQITYTQLLQRAEALSHHLRVTYNVKVGDIIGQCVERSIDMIIGMFAIMLAGAVYCPLNPTDPLERLLTIIKDTRARVILTHTSTVNKFSMNNTGFVTVNIQSDDDSITNYHDLPSVFVNPDSVAYLIHTSGSTGKPKSVQLTHGNFLNALNGYHTSGVYCLPQDRLLQMAACSFDIHVMECLGPLINGSTCVMLKPHGNLDLAYVVATIQRHRVNTACFVPSFLYALYDHLEQTNQFHLLSSMRQIVFGGEACHATRLAPIFAKLSQPSLSIELVNGYGPAETCVIAAYHRVTQKDLDQNVIPIGVPLPNYTCYILDEYLSRVPVNKLGELYIGGRGVFSGYFGDDDKIRSLNEKVLVRLPFEETLCYRTGDLCRLLDDGEIVYCGRTDHQVKLRGQRLEIGEIEECVMRIESIANCVVVMQTDIRTQQDFLIAFVESHSSNNIDNLCKTIMHQCRMQLPDYMVPSVIKVMDKLPLNANGKIDRKQLPDVEGLLDESTTHIAPRTELERYVHARWSHLLHRSDISVLAEFPSIGGDSILCMKLLSTFQTEFKVTHMTIRDLFMASTIEQQAKLLQMSEDSSFLFVSSPLHCTGSSIAPASHAQQRIYFDEQLRFNNNDPNILSVYSIPIATRIEEGQFDVQRLYKALCQLIERHEILRTTYTWNEEFGILQQCVRSVGNYQQLEWCINESNIIDSINRPFNLNNGPLVRCNVIVNENEKVESFIICIHHIAFDGASISIFCSELKALYNDQILSPLPLQYIDYTIQVDQIVNEDDATHRQYWINTLAGCIKNELLLPFDRSRLFSTNRTGAAGVIHHTFSPLLLTQMKVHRESNQITCFMQVLTVYQMFLARLTGQSDICIGSVNANRPRVELTQLIGFFVNTLPYRIHISSQHDTFEILCIRMKQICLDILEHASFPFDEIVQLHRNSENQNKIKPFFQTLFRYEDVDEFKTYVNFSEDTDSSIRTSEHKLDASSTMFDLQLLIRHQRVDDGQEHLCIGAFKY